MATKRARTLTLINMQPIAGDVQIANELFCMMPRVDYTRLNNCGVLISFLKGAKCYTVNYESQKVQMIGRVSNRKSESIQNLF